MTRVLDEAVAGKGLVAAFQRVVALPSETVVGYEALARWPALNNPAPADIFARAGQTGRLNTLDRACIRAAARGRCKAAPRLECCSWSIANLRPDMSTPTRTTS